MTGNNPDFFESPQAAAVYKHKLVKSYVPAWAGKVGSTSQGRRVIVYDAYSGPGRYRDEAPGSPELLVDTAVAMAQLRDVFSIFSEKDQGYCDRLGQTLEEKGVDPTTYEIRRGPVEQHIDAVLTGAGDLPLFVFLDPYGLTISFDEVVRVLTARDHSGWSQPLQPKTEILMNFSYEAVRRIAGALRSQKDYRAKQGQVEALNHSLGGSWWQDIAAEEQDGWVNEVLSGYATRVAKAAGYGFVTADVADSLQAQPVYELILFTRHMDGLWEMTRSMSMARKEWRQWLTEQKENAAGGQGEFRGLDFADDEDAWVEEIAANIDRILQEQSSFTVNTKLGMVLGRTLGLARETHIRRALKLLQQRQVIAVVPTGSLQRALISRK